MLMRERIQRCLRVTRSFSTSGRWDLQRYRDSGCIFMPVSMCHGTLGIRARCDACTAIFKHVSLATQLLDAQVGTIDAPPHLVDIAVRRLAAFPTELPQRVFGGALVPFGFYR